MKLIDTHAHINFAAYKDDFSDVIKRSQKIGMGIINIGTQYSTSQQAVSIAHQYKDIWAAIGTHPINLQEKNIDDFDDNELLPEEMTTVAEEVDFDKFLNLAKDNKVVAIGEIGLDYHHFKENDDINSLKQKQQEALIKFIDIANEVNKPIIIHCWDAYEDLLKILKTHPANKKGVIHSFIGGYKTARKFINLGYAIGINGIATYSDNYKRLIREIELESVVLETDCPYLAPASIRGQRNEPIYVIEVAQFIADVLEVPLEKVFEKTTINAKRIFGLESV